MLVDSNLLIYPVQAWRNIYTCLSLICLVKLVKVELDPLLRCLREPYITYTCRQ